MCCECCLCCFRSMSPLAIAITALVLDIIGFVFIIWRGADYLWVKKYQKALFWIGFVLALLSLLGVIALLVIVLVRNSSKSPGLNSIGRTITQVTLILSLVAFLLLLGSSIATIVDYIKLENEFKGVSVIPGRYWASAIVPIIMYLVFISVLAKCLKALHIIFSKDIYDNIQAQNEIDEGSRIRNQNEQTNATINNTVPGVSNQMVLNAVNPLVNNQNIASTTPMENLNNNPNPNYAMNNMNNMNPAYPKIN